MNPQYLSSLNSQWWKPASRWFTLWCAITLVWSENSWGQSPQFVVQPSGASATIGGRVILRASAQGEGPLSYRWLKDGVDLSDGVVFSGTSSSNLAIVATTRGVAGTYQLRATSPIGSSLSSNAVLVVTELNGTLDVAYVVNREQNSLSLISRETLSVLHQIPVGDQPLHVVSSHDQHFVAVGNQGSHNVTLIDAQLGRSVASIPVGLGPEGMAWSRDDKLLFVANSGSSSISVIDASTRAVVNTLQTPRNPSAIALHPSRNEMWIGYNNTGTVLEVRGLGDYGVLGSIQSTDRAYASGGLSFSPDGASVWSIEGCGCCGRFHQLAGAVEGGVVNVVRRDLLFDNTGAASSATVHPTTGEAYLAKTGHCNGGVPSVQKATGGPRRTLQSLPRQTALDPSRNQLWITLANGGVDVLSADDFTTVKSLQVGKDPFGISLGSFNFGADLQVTREPVPNPVTVGSNFLYTLVVSNAGPNTAELALLKAEFPMELQLVDIQSSQGATRRFGNQLEVDLGILAPGTTTTLHCTVRATCLGRPFITASALSSTGDPVTANNSIEPSEIYIDPLYANYALNLSGADFPSAAASDSGWGSAIKPQELLDGARSYNTWSHGLAFTGGHSDENDERSNGFVEPAGLRQATVDFGTNRAFEKVVLWHHGEAHIPATTALDYWDGNNWISITFNRVQGRRLELGQDSGSANSDEYYFSPVTGSKLRYRFDNRERNVMGSWILHGWLYEIEVLGRSPKQPPGGSLTVSVNGVSVADGPSLVDNPTGDAMRVEIESCPAGSAIRYTLDGSLPNALSQPYVKSILVLPPARLRAAIVQGNIAYGHRDVRLTSLSYYSLSSTVAGEGSLLLPPGFKNPVREGAFIEVTALPAPGWSLMGWEGDTIGTGQVVHVLMNGNRTLKALFGRPFSVNIESASESVGTVAISPKRDIYAPGEKVSLTALPSTESRLIGWGSNGLVESTANPLVWVIDSNRTEITAYFGKKPGNELVLNLSPLGEGTILRDPDQGSYTSNSFVTVSAIAGDLQVFDRWDGDLSSSRNPIVVRMNSNVVARAVFVPRIPPQVLLSQQDGGNSIFGPTNINLTATARSENSRIRLVEIFDGTQLLASVDTDGTQVVATVTLTNLPPRTNAYALVAKAHDARGLVGESAVANLLISDAPDFVRFGFDVSVLTLNESQGYVTVVVNKIGSSPGSVWLSTEPRSAQPVVNGSGDYYATNILISFKAGESTKYASIQIVDDRIQESREKFIVKLTPTGRSGLVGSGTQTIEIVDGTALPGDSLMDYLPPPFRVEGTNGLRVFIDPGSAGGRWRFLWETEWRTNGSMVQPLAAGNYGVQFQPIPGFATIEPVLLKVEEGGITTYTQQALATGTPRKGSLQVRFMGQLPEGAGWNFQGETTVHSADNLEAEVRREGDYTIEFRRVDGYREPPARSVHIWGDQQADFTAAYEPEEPTAKDRVVPLPLPDYKTIRDSAAQTPALPYAWVGQIRSSSGNGSGFAARERVVVTAGHVVFDTASLASAGDIFWFPQRHAARNEAAKNEERPIQPRGWILMSGYAEELRRTRDENLPNSAESTDLDAAVLYFSTPAVRGGYSGYLADNDGSWLTETTNHMLVGYPTRGTGISPGLMHATAAGNYGFKKPDARFGYCISAAFTGYPGASGGPLCVLTTNAVWQPAGIYLGITADGDARVRALDGQLVALIRLAVDIANQSSDQTDSGVGPIIALPNGLSGSESTRVQLNLEIAPPELLDDLQRLRRHLIIELGANTNTLTAYTLSNTLSLSLSIDTKHVKLVRFTGLPGWIAPDMATISHTVGQGTSLQVRYEREEKPLIRSEATTVFATAGFPMSMVSAASGAGPIRIQWLRNGTLLSEQASTNPALTIANIRPSDVGSYQWIALNAFGSATSAPIKLIVGPVLRWDGKSLRVEGAAGTIGTLERIGSLVSPSENWQPLSDLTITNQTQVIWSMPEGARGAEYFRMVLKP